MLQRENQVIVIGHRNPDTDSICSAISYAYLKNQIRKGDEVYVPKRAGELNEETTFVLQHFGVAKPELITDVGTQVRDLEISTFSGVTRKLSLKKAWNTMEETGKQTLAVTDEQGRLEGIITLEDIATSYMNIYENNTLANATTPYRNLVETIEGELLVGNSDDVITGGKVLIAAANPDLMEDYIGEQDVVITGNRYESQLCAIEMGADCVIVCEGASVSRTIRKLAADHRCHLISTKFDAFTVARLINQSIPVRHFMRSRNLTTFRPEDTTDKIKEIMAKKKYRDFPILNEDGNYLGMVSRRNLISPKRKQVIIMDHNELSQAVHNIQEAEILEIIDHHRIGTLETVSPVYFRNQPVGCTSTIVYQMFMEQQVEIPPHIAGLLCSAIISDTLLFRSPTCTPIDEAAAKYLAAIAGIEPQEYAGQMFHAGSNLAHKTAEEIFLQDFKKFTIQEVGFGVGQINSMSEEELEGILEKLLPYLEQAKKEQDVTMLFFMLTNILDKSTMLLYAGEGARELVSGAFGVEAGPEATLLSGVVSRKKQLIPQFAIELQGESR